MKLLIHTIAFGVSCAPGLAQWSTDSLSLARSDLGATTAGSIALFAGGRFDNTNSGTTSVVDLYDGATGTWSTASLSGPKGWVRAASAGGVALFSGAHTPVVDVFDSASGNWSVTQGVTGMYHAVAAAGDKILFGGGGSPSAPSAAVDMYDTVSGTWSHDVLSQARASLAATGVGDLALFGGGCVTQTPVCMAFTTVDIFDVQTGNWSTAALSEGRSFLAATSVGGKALFAGGLRSDGTLSARVDIYDTAAGTWSQASLSQARGDITATSVGRFALFAGGYTGSQAFSDRVDIYDSRDGTWSTASLSVGRFRMAATGVGDLALFAGGETAISQRTDVIDVFDSRLGTMYCIAAPNSTGLPGILTAEGTLAVAAGDLTLIAEQLPPGQFGYFITGLTQGLIQPPGSQGPICLSGNIGRYNRAGEIIQGPLGSLQLDLTSIPVNPPTAVMPGDTWNFQCWYRDINPAPTSNTTNGLAITFATTGDPSVQFPVTQASIVEDATQVEVRITLSQATNEDVILTYVTGGTATVDIDWRVEEPNPFVIPAGHTAADMTLTIAEDGLQESDELAIVSLVAPIGAVLGTATTFTLTIVDDD